MGGLKPLPSIREGSLVPRGLDERGFWLATALACLLWRGTLVHSAEPTAAAQTAAERDRFFAEEVQPILQANCLKCHGGGKKIKGGLRLTRRAAILAGGDLGPAVALEKPDQSLLLRAISYADGDLKMPPSGKLPDDAVETLTRWVRLGLPFPSALESGPSEAETVTSDDAGLPPHVVTPERRNFWSFRPVTRPEPPAVKDPAWARTPIDHFVLSKLEGQGVLPNSDATQLALFRRATYDLTGLPPTPTDVQAFLADDSPNAYERVVDRLLTSPRYGERWGRHWLDVVRYGESNSFERDSMKPNVWRYRDYVIEAFNAGMPYDRFIREQLAGDELEKVTPETIVATGYYRIGTWDDEPTDRLQARYDELDDIVSTTSQAFLALTLNCARCHDHKLDPVPQTNYYSMLAFFHGVLPFKYGDDNVQSVISQGAERSAYEEAKKNRDDRIRQIEVEREAIVETVISQLSADEREAAGNRRLRGRLFEKYQAEHISEATLKRYRELRSEKDKANKVKLPPVQFALSVKEAGPEAPETYVLVRGNAHAKGKQVEPGFPSVLGAAAPKLSGRARPESSGRRSALAEWITSEDNQLTARVMVNRIWQHHFGRGIVRSPNNFGKLGVPPTHPALLDWLASEFVASGWSIKHMHRLMMTSRTYRMAASGGHGQAADPENQLFWRMNPRRLSAEEIRDSILSVSGELNLKAGGPPIYPAIQKDVLHSQSRPGLGWNTSTPHESTRRSVFVHVKRSLGLPILTAFDFADTDSTCPVRFTTTQPTQALTLLNSAFLNQSAASFATRLGREVGTERPVQVARALHLALARQPTDDEVARGVRLIRDLEGDEGLVPDKALQQFCLLVLNLNEFFYID
jgi:hypothetical protein